MTTYGAALRLPDWAWQTRDLRNALAGRDVGALFRLTQRYSGASQAQLATAVGLTQSRVNEVINGRRQVLRLDVLERIAVGLQMPDPARQLFGLAPHATVAPEIARVYADQAAAAEDIRRTAQVARVVDVLAVRGLGLLGLNDSLLRGPLLDRERLAVRAMLLHPTGPAAEQRAAEIGETPEAMAAGIQLATDRLAELGHRPGATVEVRWYRQVPTWRMIALDDAMFVSVFDGAAEGHSAALYQLVPATGCVLYRGYRRMFEALRVGAERVV